MSQHVVWMSIINWKIRNGDFPNVMAIFDRKVGGGDRASILGTMHSVMTSTLNKVSKIKDLSREI